MKLALSTLVSITAAFNTVYHLKSTSAFVVLYPLNLNRYVFTSLQLYLIGFHDCNIQCYMIIVPDSKSGIFPRSSLLGAGQLGFWEFGRGGTVG